MSDPTLLTLVIDDPLAPRVLACWKALRLQLSEQEDRLPDIARMSAGSLTDVRTTLLRCGLAGLLVDGGISETADQWLSAHIGARLGAKPKKKKN